MAAKWINSLDTKSTLTPLGILAYVFYNELHKQDFIIYIRVKVKSFVNKI